MGAVEGFELEPVAHWTAADGRARLEARSGGPSRAAHDDGWVVRPHTASAAPLLAEAGLSSEVVFPTLRAAADAAVSVLGGHSGLRRECAYYRIRGVEPSNCDYYLFRGPARDGTSGWNTVRWWPMSAEQNREELGTGYPTRRAALRDLRSKTETVGAPAEEGGR